MCFSNKIGSLFILIVSLNFQNCTEEQCYYNWRAFAPNVTDDKAKCKPGEVFAGVHATNCDENTCLQNVNRAETHCKNRKCKCDPSLYRGFNDECVRLDECIDSYRLHLTHLEDYKNETPITNVNYRLKQPTVHTVHVLCYDDLGCFDRHRITGELPEIPEVIHATVVYFAKRKLFDQLPMNGSVQLYPSPSNFIPNQFLSRIVCISHGWGGSVADDQYLELMKLFLRNEHIDLVLLFDWGQSTTPGYNPFYYVYYYLRAAANTELIGRQLGLILANWRKKSLITSHSIYLWGFSLGAHVMTFAANFYTIHTNEQVRHLNLMDAANPAFDNIVLRPTPAAAQFVEAYHTSGDDDLLPKEALKAYSFGIYRPMGHIDFYINNGTESQPGCLALPQCSHNAVINFFKTSFNCDAISIHCDSYDGYRWNASNSCNFKDISTLGLKSETSVGRGRHYIDTKEETNICDQRYEHKQLLKQIQKDENPYLRARKRKKMKLFG